VEARFVATPTETESRSALECWPELAAKRVRPLLVTAFGDIFVELADGPVMLVDTLALAVREVAPSVTALTSLFDDPTWASEHLLIELVLLADERGVRRKPEEVFAVAPHPTFQPSITVERLMPMSLRAWHHICASILGRAT
jgi:hypothetical protein